MFPVTNLDNGVYQTRYSPVARPSLSQASVGHGGRGRWEEGPRSQRGHELLKDKAKKKKGGERKMP